MAGKPKAWRGDLAKLTDAELVGLQTHKNDWFVRHARRLLQERAAAGDTHQRLQTLLNDAAESPTKLRAVFEWRDQQGTTIATDRSDWQAVRRWEGPDDRGGWSRLVAGFRAPAEAAQLAISFQPASDDRVYLDDIHVRETTDDRRPTTDDGGRRGTTGERGF